MLAHTRNRRRAVVRVGVSEESVKNGIKNLAIKRYGDASPASLQKLFNDYDQNGDGCLNGSELNRMLAAIDQCVPVLGCNPVSKRIIDALDTDGNRCITWEEYAAKAGIDTAPPEDPTKKLTEKGPIKPVPISGKPKYSEFTKGGDKTTGTVVKPGDGPKKIASTDSGGGGILIAGAVLGLFVLMK